MPGSGRSGDSLGNNIGAKIWGELRSAFALLRRDLKQHSIDLVIPGSEHLTVYQSQFNCQTHHVYFGRMNIPVRDGLHRADEKPLQATIAGGATLLTDHQINVHQTACDWQAVIAYESIFRDMQLAHHHVSFENITHTIPHPMAIPQISDNFKISQLKPEKLQQVDVFEIPPVRFTTKKQVQEIPKPRIRTSTVPRKLFSLPSRKHPLPLHRFPSEVKEHFRRALARKVGIPPANILVKAVYDRMNPALYKNINQEEREILLCHPKEELVGRNRDRELMRRANVPASYLIFGLRLDTKQAISALVPMQDLDTLRKEGS